MATTLNQTPAPTRAQRGGNAPVSAAEEKAKYKPTLLLILLACCLFSACIALPTVQRIPQMQFAFEGAAAFLFLFLAVLAVAVKRSGRKLTWQFVPRPQHYVQLFMHSSIYAYWGWYWPNVYPFAPMLVAQIFYLYALDMLIGWSRRDKWILGFGQIPIILSTNLFLWFRPQFFIWQFALITLIALGKEFVRWQRNGESRHIFNPSAFALSIFAVVLLATNNTGMTWGPEIAQTLHLPPYIYIEIFCIGMIVQGLFQVTLVTLCAAASLYALNLIYTGATGLYYFIDTGIPVSVFIGLHLLVTDPATSPRSMKGKAIFGGLYGVGVFILYSLLGRFDMPQFYDKLLTVPILNLLVPALDRLSTALENLGDRLKWSLPSFVRSMSAVQLNFAHMGIWILLFGAMTASGFIGHTHPGDQVAFWEKACRKDGKTAACPVFERALREVCVQGNGMSCMALADIAAEGKIVPKDVPLAGASLGRACDDRVEGACATLAAFVKAGNGKEMGQACDHGDAINCFVLGSLAHTGDGLSQDEAKAFAWFRRSCDLTLARGCSRLGESYAFGEGTQKDPARALKYFETACTSDYAPACVNAAVIYGQGLAGKPDNARAKERLADACRMGVKQACL